MAKNVIHTGEFIGMLASLAARAIPFASVYYLQSCRGLQLVCVLVVLTMRLVVVVLLLEMDSSYTNMINATEYRNAKAMVSI